MQAGLSQPDEGASASAASSASRRESLERAGMGSVQRRTAARHLPRAGASDEAPRAERRRERRVKGPAPGARLRPSGSPAAFRARTATMRPVPFLRRAPRALALAVAASAGCRGAPPPEPGPIAQPALSVSAPPEVPAAEPPPAVPAPDVPPAERARDAAQSALAAGDIAATRAALDALVTAPLLATCEAHLLGGRVEQALVAAEEALATSPELPAALYVAGACRAALGVRRDDAAERERALDLLERARACSGALGMASGIARGLGRFDEALELARAGLAPHAGACEEVQRVAVLAVPPELAERPERALASASLAAWRARRADEPARAAKHFEEAEGALQLALQHDAVDAWPWRTLGEAYIEAGKSADAL